MKEAAGKRDRFAPRGDRDDLEGVVSDLIKPPLREDPDDLILSQQGLWANIESIARGFNQWINEDSKAPGLREAKTAFSEMATAARALSDAMNGEKADLAWMVHRQFGKYPQADDPKHLLWEVADVSEIPQGPGLDEILPDQLRGSWPRRISALADWFEWIDSQAQGLDARGQGSAKSRLSGITPNRELVFECRALLSACGVTKIGSTRGGALQLLSTALKSFALGGKPLEADSLNREACAVCRHDVGGHMAKILGYSLIKADAIRRRGKNSDLVRRVEDAWENAMISSGRPTTTHSATK